MHGVAQAALDLLGRKGGERGAAELARGRQRDSCGLRAQAFDLARGARQRLADCARRIGDARGDRLQRADLAGLQAFAMGLGAQCFDLGLRQGLALAPRAPRR